MNLSRSTLAILTVVLALGGCATPKVSFLGGPYPKLSYNDLGKREVPLRLKLNVEFQRNGEHFPKGDVPLRDYANQILRDTGAITPVEEGQEGEIRVVLNNVADPQTVAAERASIMHPLWMVGTTITDAYELSMFITMKGKTIARMGIKNAVHTALGNIRIPDNIQTFPHNQAFGKVLEQMMLRALVDMQRTGELATLASISPPALRQLDVMEFLSFSPELTPLRDRSAHEPGLPHQCPAICLRSRGWIAGPSITLPSGAKRLP